MDNLENINTTSRIGYRWLILLGGLCIVVFPTVIFLFVFLFPIDLFLLEIMVLFIIYPILIVILHFKIGEYPEEHPRSDEPKKEIIHITVLYSLLIVGVIIIVLIMLSAGLDLTNRYGLEQNLLVFFLLPVFGIYIPYALIRFVDKPPWTLEEQGLITEIKQPLVWIYVIGITIGLGVAEIFLLAVTGMLTTVIVPWWFFLLVILSNIFFEEYLFRAIILTKFERITTQGKAIILHAIIFGLVHIPTNFFFAVLMGQPFNLIGGIILLIIQTLAGLVLGITYAKTRSLIPCCITHYLMNYFVLLVLIYPW